jgi:3-methyladenine DNA glycosylase Tag
MSLRLATVNENARSALDCGREAAAFSSFPSAHAPKTSETKAVAAATAVQSAFGTAIFIAEARRRRDMKAKGPFSASLRLCGKG